MLPHPRATPPAHDRLLASVDELVRALGLQPRRIEPLIATVRAALASVASDGHAIERVAVVRRRSAVEVQLHGAPGQVDTILSID